MAKLVLKKKKQRDDDDEEEVTSKKSAPKRMEEEEEFSDEDFFQEGLALEWAKANAPNLQTYKPDWWIDKEDDKNNLIMFTAVKPSFTLLVHSTKEGKFYPKVTCCSSTRPCKYCEVAAPKSAIGHKYSTFMWQIRQLRKWEDKDKNIHWVSYRFWSLTEEKTKALMKLLAKHGDKALEQVYEVVPGGKGSFSLIPSELSDKWLERVEEGPEPYTKDDLRKIYAPPSDKEAEAHIAKLLGGRTEDEDDDESPVSNKKKKATPVEVDDEVPF